MRTVSNTTPTTRPQNQVLKNGLQTTYVSWRPRTLKDGKIVYHKHSYTRIRKPQRKKRVQGGQYKQLKTRKANEFKKSILDNLDIFTVDDLDYIIQRFNKDPEEFKTRILK